MKRKEIHINTFDDLIQLIESGTLSAQQTIEIVEKTISVFICLEEVDNIAENLKAYWLEYGKSPQTERPLFLQSLTFEEKLKIPAFKKVIDKIEAYY